jgi:hypothetical protein
MIYIFLCFGLLIVVWLWLRWRKGRGAPGPEGKRIGWKIDKTKGKAYGLYLVDGKIVEREEEDVILDTAS